MAKIGVGVRPGDVHNRWCTLYHAINAMRGVNLMTHPFESENHCCG